MKNLIYTILTAAVFMLVLDSCSENETPVQASFNLSQNIVEMPPEGGSATVTYEIENPEDGVGIVVGDDHPEWVSGFDISESGRIHFNVDSTDIEIDSRECDISVSYGDITQTFKVMQIGADPAINFQIVAVSPVSVIVRTETKDENMNKYVNIIEKSVWDTLGTEEALLDEDVETFEKYAEMSGITFEQWLINIFEYTWHMSPYLRLYNVANPENGYREVLPDTEYVAYTYGINGKGEVLSKVYSIECATEALNLSNQTDFDIEFTVSGTYVEARI